MQDMVPSYLIGCISVNVEVTSAVDDISDNNQDMSADDEDYVNIQAPSAIDDVSNKIPAMCAIDKVSNNNQAMTIVNEDAKHTADAIATISALVLVDYAGGVSVNIQATSAVDDMSNNVKSMSAIDNDPSNKYLKISAALTATLPEENGVPLATTSDAQVDIDQLVAEADDVVVQPPIQYFNAETIVQAHVIKMDNRAHLFVRSKLIKATDGKKIAFVNGTKFKSRLLS
jgi:hypothetical protein